MSSNTINDLRTELFDTLRALKDKDNPMDIERARAVMEVGQVIINSAKTEVDFMKANGSVDTQFFQQPTYPPVLPGTAAGADEVPQLGGHKTKDGTVTMEQRGGQQVLVHKLQ